MLKVWDVETGRELMSFKAHEREGTGFKGVNGVAFSPDGQQLLSGGDIDVK